MPQRALTAVVALIVSHKASLPFTDATREEKNVTHRCRITDRHIIRNIGPYRFLYACNTSALASPKIAVMMVAKKPRSVNEKEAKSSETESLAEDKFRGELVASITIL